MHNTVAAVTKEQGEMSIFWLYAKFASNNVKYKYKRAKHLNVLKY